MKTLFLGAICCFFVHCFAQAPIEMIHARIRELDKLDGTTVKMKQRLADEFKEREVLFVLLANFENFMYVKNDAIERLFANLQHKNVLSCFDRLLEDRRWLQQQIYEQTHQDLIDESRVQELTKNLDYVDRGIVQLLNKIMRIKTKKVRQFACD